MPQVFDSEDLRFQYPDGWIAERELSDEGRLSATIRSGDNAFWTATTYPATEPAQELADTVLEVMRQEYPGLESDEVQAELIGGRPALGYDLNFWYLDLTNTASVRVISTNAARYLVFWQSGDQELSRVEPVFEAMTQSVLRESPGGSNVA
jgi:hypothetical protein